LRVTQTVDQFTLGTFALMLVFSSAVAIPVARRTARPWWQVVLAFASVAAILAVTLVGRVRKLSPFNIGRWSVDWLHDGDLWRHAFDIDRGWLLNVALFVPAGAVITYVTRRPSMAFFGLVVGSLAIELVQRRYGLGAADPADLLANTIGAGIGVLIGVFAGRDLG
jgi:glycopeptide antibiotics resistance protein